MNKCREMYDYRIIVSMLHEGEIDMVSIDCNKFDFLFHH